MARALPALGWLSDYERRWLRGDLARGDRRHGLDRAEEPRVCGHRRSAAAERALRGGRRARSSTRSSAPRATSRRGRARRLRPWPAARSLLTSVGGEQAAELVAAIALATGLLFLLLALLRWVGSPSFLSRAVVTGFLAGAAVDVVIGELPKLTGTVRRGRQRLAGAGVVAGIAGRHRTARRCSSGVAALAVILGLVRSRPRSRVRWSWSSADCWPRRCSISARTAWRSSATCPRGLPAPELPDLGAGRATTTRPSPSRRWHCS